MNAYFEVIMSAPPRSILDKLLDVLVAISREFPSQYKQQWFSSVFQRVPTNVLTQEEKGDFLNKILKPEREEVLLDDFEIIAKRAKNSVLRGS